MFVLDLGASHFSVAAVAQWIEYWPPKPRVVGSIPASRTSCMTLMTQAELCARFRFPAASLPCLTVADPPLTASGNQFLRLDVASWVTLACAAFDQERRMKISSLLQRSLR
jgi:hypothetical protein